MDKILFNSDLIETQDSKVGKHIMAISFSIYVLLVIPATLVLRSLIDIENESDSNERMYLYTFVAIVLLFFVIYRVSYYYANKYTVVGKVEITNSEVVLKLNDKSNHIIDLGKNEYIKITRGTQYHKLDYDIKENTINNMGEKMNIGNNFIECEIDNNLHRYEFLIKDVNHNKKLEYMINTLNFNKNKKRLFYSI